MNPAFGLVSPASYHRPRITGRESASAGRQTGEQADVVVRRPPASAIGTLTEPAVCRARRHATSTTTSVLAWAAHPSSAAVLESRHRNVGWVMALRGVVAVIRCILADHVVVSLAGPFLVPAIGRAWAHACVSGRARDPRFSFVAHA